MEKQVACGLPSERRGSGHRGLFDDRARMVLIVGAILLTALGFVVYIFVRDPTVLVTNQAMTFIVGYYFHDRKQ
jgi:hypothetical protein